MSYEIIFQQSNGRYHMTADQNHNIQVAGLGDRLAAWRQNLQDNIESSARKAIDAHSQAMFKQPFSDVQKLEFEMNRVMETAVQKVEDMKKYEMNADKIREAILPAIQNMASPYQHGSELNQKFGELQKQVFDRVDAQILGNDAVFRRNNRI
jgi:hypothetical protein